MKVRRLSPYVAAALTIISFLSIVAVLDRSERQKFREEKRANVLNQLSTVRARLEGSLNQRIFLTRGLVSYISTLNPDISQEEFESLARVMVAQQPGIPSAALYENNICTHLYPLKGQEEALGFDPMKVPEEREAFQRAIETKSTVLAGPVELVKGGMAFITRTPIFLTPPDTKPEAGPYWGMVSIGIDQDILFQEAGLLDEQEELLYTIRGRDGLGENGKVFFGDASIFQYKPVRSQVTLPNGSWELAAVPVGGWPVRAPNSKWLWLGGGLIALLAGILMFVLVSAPARLRLAVQRATLKLRKNEEALERRVAERTAELAIAKEKAEVANQTKSTFLANMSHELRSPLNAVLGFAQLMIRSHSLPAEHQENVTIINRSGEHLLTLINNILDLSKIEAGRITLNAKNFDLHRLLDDLEDMFKLKAEEKGLQLVFEHDSHLPRYLRTDEVKLRQVLINLLSNALKFTESGGVSVRSFAEEEVENFSESSLSSSSPQQIITFEVEDTGPGIASEELDSLFEAFVQTGTGIQAQEGTGLGLPISRKFVQMMGGEIQVSSEVGCGSTFKFDICADLVDDAEMDSKQPAHRVIALEPNQVRYRILIVDDKQINRQLLVKFLAPLGFELREASNGREAIAIWDEWEPQLIWMDMRMPVMDGYEATKQIKNHIKGQATAIVALTASVLEEERAVILSAGCDDFLRKPFREEDIFDAMSKHVGVRYIYEDQVAVNSSNIKATEPQSLTPDAFANLPTEWLVSLKQAILNLDLDLITNVIEQIRQENPLLANALNNCINDFEYDTILTLIPENYDDKYSSK